MNETTIRQITIPQWIPKKLASEIDKWNDTAAGLNDERRKIATDIEALRQSAMTGEAGALDGLAGRRQKLGQAMLAATVQAVKHAESRDQFTAAVQDAHEREKQQRRKALADREAHLNAVFEEHGIVGTTLQGIRIQSSHGQRQAVRELDDPPQIVTDADRAAVAALRQEISNMM